ncbi:ATP-binding protein [Devosia sp.]|uniref:ATP-binding protein n=1 Tax=Devosia sp. TaxID=1871048 RepID=UPI0032647950
MRRPWSIALRLALWLSLGTGLFWLGAAAISSAVLQHELQEAFDETLSQSAIRLLPLALHDLREPGERHGPIEAIDDRDAAAFTYFVHDGAGNVIIRADDAPEGINVVPTAEGYFELDGKRAYAITDLRSGLGIVVLEMTTHRQEALGDAASALFWPLAGLLPLIAVGIWIAVRLGMRPLRTFARDVALRDETNLSPLNADGQPAELAPIAREVAALLDRLKSAMESERSFAANSAHELRTPIAGALAQTQRLALELGDHPARQRVRDVELSLNHLSQLSENLLQLARLEAGFARSDALVDIRPVLELVVRDFQTAQATTGRVRMEGIGGVDLRAPVTADAVAIVLRNVIQNALAHGSTGGVVEVKSSPGPTITVLNRGPVVAPDVLAQLGTRFTRGDTSATGTGLGLAIVKAIMDQVGARVTLASPIPGQTEGFEVTLDFSKAR